VFIARRADIPGSRKSYRQRDGAITAQTAEILKLLHEGTMPQSKIAHEFMVSRARVSELKRRLDVGYYGDVEVLLRKERRSQ
jgi:hypothetical protein